MQQFNFKMIASLIGTLLMIVSLMMLVSLFFSFYYGENWHPMLISSGITFGFGIGLYLLNTKNTNKEVRRRDGFLIVALGWISMSVFGSLPYLISGAIPGIIDALFETVSGITTTGATILTDIEIMPKYLLFWRSMTHWLGGMGIIVLTIAILPLLGVGGMQLFLAEAPGVTPDKLHPRITETAKRLWIIYFLLTASEAVLLKIAGMGGFDAINHAMATMATGGFSTKNASIAYFTSPAIHYIIMVFMFLAGVNFTLLYFGLTGRVKTLLRNEEFRVYGLNILALGAITAIGLILIQGTDVELAFRNGFFQVISIVTTTGFVSDNYLLWPNFLMVLIFVLFFSGGSTGSTAGGIKMMRMIVLLKNSFLELKRQIHPSAVVPVRFNGMAVPQNITNTIAAFVLIYLIIFFLGSLVMSAMGLDFMTATGAVAATLGNIGPGIGNVGPVDNFAFMPPAGKVFLSFLMLLGRLELFTMLILFLPYFWRNN
ncbi:MAG TPA: potassium transporter [Cryomorphaceae bacterium]|nr:potassium transporter [Owenweeksia sp.]HAD97833.1 potassium transporter [Cryomorphaceae bacterium]|tara:strand:+ start:244 stop:1701 length:1458 start_codon:yes stop_codon:yes gene_type:complete